LLYHKYKNDVYRFCYSLLGDRDLADDAFQETFVKIYEKRELFTGGNFKAWMLTIARNTCYNYLRLQKNRVDFDESYLGAKRDTYMDSGLQSNIRQAVNELPVQYREIIILREYEDYSYNEIAEILEINLTLVKVRIHRARVLLKEKLESLVKEIYESR
jgi:RNA polymerase sigma-70 factor (ECF subfamily)